MKARRFSGSRFSSSIPMEEIESKLKNIATGADENVSFQKAMTRLKNARNAVDNGRRGGALPALCAERAALRAQMEQLAATALRHRRLQQELTEKMRARAALEQRIRELCAQTEAHEQRRRGDLEQRRAALAREQAELAAVRDALARELGGAGREELDRAKEVLYRYEAQAAGRGSRTRRRPCRRARPSGSGRSPRCLASAGWPCCFSGLRCPAQPRWARGSALRRSAAFCPRPHAKKKAAWAAVRDRERAEAAASCGGARRAQGRAGRVFFGHFGVSDESQWKPCLRKLEQALAAYTDTDARLRVKRPCGRRRWRRPAPPAPPRETAAALAGARRQAARLDTEIAAMQGELQVRLEHQQAADGLQSRINELDEREAELRRRLEVYNLALAALENAHDEMTRLFAPALNERAAELFASLAGPARTVKIDAAGDVRIEEGGAVHEIGYYSTGTADAAYIAMRLACVELLYTEEKPPLACLDDSLCNLDPARKAAAFALLARLAERYQILYFTCHDETAALGGAQYSRILL